MGALQREFAINKPGDEYEHEADRVAEQVMGMPEPRLPRTCACGGGCPRCQTEHDHGRLQARHVQTSDTGQMAAPPIVHEVLAAPAQSLDPATRAFFEPRFGQDFRDVQIHTGDRAGASARAVGARAYTVGRNVVFAPAQFAPSTDHGRRLLAHELVHVIQQTSGGAAEIARVPEESGIRGGRYTFSTNCGWIDWSHSVPLATRALELIQRVQRASDALRNAGTAATPTTGQLTTPTMDFDPSGVQLIIASPFSTSIRVRLLRPLSGSEVNEVALSIFKELSIAFERQQAFTDPPRLPLAPAGSSFAHEDLPSNLIGFYMAVRGFRRPEIMTACGGLDVSSSVAEFRRNHNFVQNFSFSPIGATGPWPTELSTINDSAAATLYETQRISPTQNLRFNYCPMYRVAGSLRSSLVDLPNQPRFSVTDDLRVVPTTFETSSDTGIMNYIRVRPARPSDEARFRQVGALWPRDLPVQVLRCLTSHGNPV